mgnify:CR=1 FL=1
MEIIKEINKDILAKDICFIPTMGALHKGHASLIKEGKKSSLPVMVSIFVNQMQFNDKEDFNNYPKPIDEDIKILENFNIDYLFIPENDYIYPKNNFEKVSSGNLGKLLEGSSRPGHFDGVLTVVNRFFQLINPKIAISYLNKVIEIDSNDVNGLINLGKAYSMLGEHNIAAEYYKKLDRLSDEDMQEYYNQFYNKK